MFTHKQLWNAIDGLADKHGLSASGLAKRAGLDPTAFNPSKRVGPDGRERWPTTESLSKVLAAEFSPRGIRINALLPGGTDTPGATMDTLETLAFVEGLHAMKRIARPDEIAESALYLASNMSSFTTGSALYVDGGVSITRT